MHWILGLLFFSINIFANDASLPFAPPCMSEEFTKLLNEQKVAHEVCISQELADAFLEGLALPWVGAFALGGLIRCKINESGEVAGSVKDAMAGGTCACVCLFPLELLLTLPCGLISVSYSSISWIIYLINAARHQSEFSYQINLHLYRWIDLVKQNRIALSKELLDQPKDLVPKLNPAQWDKLESRLIEFKAMAYEAPDLSIEDIKEYLPMTIYLIALNQEQVFKALTI